MASSEFTEHDNIGRDVTRINKDKLLLILRDCAENAKLPDSAWSNAGLALTLRSAALLTETFHKVWVVPGESIRAVFILGGIIAGIRAFQLAMRWRNKKKNTSPDAIIDSLFIPNQQTRPVALLAAPSQTRPVSPKRTVTRRRKSITPQSHTTDT